MDRDVGQVLVEPCNAALRLAVVGLFDEVCDLGLVVERGCAFDQGDLDIVGTREKKGLPFFLAAIFDRQLVIGVVRTNELREFVEGRELFVL